MSGSLWGSKIEVSCEFTHRHPHISTRHCARKESFRIIISDKAVMVLDVDNCRQTGRQINRRTEGRFQTQPNTLCRKEKRIQKEMGWGVK